MGCIVNKNTAHQVILNCAASVFASGNLSLYSGLWLAAAPAIVNLPTSGLTVMAKRIDVTGSLLPNVAITFNNTCVPN
jgi:hypothetical protein